MVREVGMSREQREINARLFEISSELRTSDQKIERLRQNESELQAVLGAVQSGTMSIHDIIQHYHLALSESTPEATVSCLQQMVARVEENLDQELIQYRDLEKERNDLKKKLPSKLRSIKQAKGPFTKRTKGKTQPKRLIGRLGEIAWRMGGTYVKGAGEEFVNFAKYSLVQHLIVGSLTVLTGGSSSPLIGSVLRDATIYYVGRGLMHVAAESRDIQRQAQRAIEESQTPSARRTGLHTIADLS